MNNKFYITTSIAYVNAPPHIGFALESVQADVLARYYRRQGKGVFFLTGTDEHGVKIARAAAADGKTPKELVDENSGKYKDLKPALDLSWNNFVRTSDRKNHWPVAQELWGRLKKSGDIYKKTYSGLYCVGHEAFITQKDLIPVINGNHSKQGDRVTWICADHKKEPEIIEEENWFFKLSRYTKEIESRIKNDELRIVPESKKNEILALLKENPEDVSFSRPSKDLSWGIPVPDDASQTMYVWADALSNYISGYEGISGWENHPADVHVIGKDILRFHALIWPAMLISAGLKLPKAIFVHGHILSDGQKMSKSLGNVIDPFELVKKYGAEAVRYFLLREIPTTGDGDFSYQKFEERYNGDLANGLGNLIARVAAIGEKLGDIKLENSIFEWFGGLTTSFKKNPYEELINNFELNKALEKIWEEIHDLDKLINQDKPWSEKNEEVLRKRIAGYGKKIIRIADLLWPFMPKTSEKIKEHFNLSGDTLKIKKGTGLFPRI